MESLQDLGVRAQQARHEHDEESDHYSLDDHQGRHGQSFPHTSGMSPLEPYWKVVSAAPLLRLLRSDQVPALNQPGRSTPVPCQSPTMGIPPGPNSKSAVAPPSVVRSIHRVPLTTPGRARPSSVHRPATGMSPAWPYSISMSAGPDELELRSSQRPFRKTPQVITPSPFQSPTTGISPARPNSKIRSGRPSPSDCFRYQTRPVSPAGPRRVPRTTPGVLTPEPVQSPIR